MENKIITIVDEDGVEKQFKFLFSSVNENTQEEFCFFIEINTPRPMVGAYKLGNDNELINIETKEDMDYAQYAFGQYMASRRGGCGGCGCHSHHHDHECGCNHDGDHECGCNHDGNHECGCNGEGHCH